MKGFMYILQCSDGSYYTGSTKNLERRLAQHQAGEGANHTKKHLPVKLVYFEEFDRIDTAFYREKQIQGWSRKKKEALINNMPEKLHDLAKCLNETSHKNIGFGSAQPMEVTMDGSDSAEPTEVTMDGFGSAQPTEVTDAERSRSGSGNIPNGWMETTLGEVAKVIMGQSPKGDTCNSIGEGIPLLNGPTEFGEVFPSPVQFTIDPRKTSQKNDLLFCVRGSTTGRMNWSNETYAIGRGIAAIRHKKGYELRKFIRGIFDFKLQQLLAEATGSTFPNVSRTQLENIEIIIPKNIKEQTAIAKILTAFDDKIELLQAQNKTLETTAQTIFKEWFASAPLSNHSAPLSNHSAPLSNSTEGNQEAERSRSLPDGWRVGKITELFEVRDGTHDSPKQVEKGKLLITSKHLTKNRLKFEDAYLISEKDFKKINKRSAVNQYDILFSMIGTIGLTYFEQSENINYAIKNVALFKTSQNTKWASYTYLWLTSFLGKHFVSTNKSGSTQEYVSLTSLRNIEFIIPKEDILLKFGALTDPIFKKIKNNSTQIQTLKKTRDTLLPKLMSGSLRVEMSEL